MARHLAATQHLLSPLRKPTAVLRQMLLVVSIIYF